MARLTLSEQVNKLASEKAELDAELQTARQELAGMRGSLQFSGQELSHLRSKLEELIELRDKLAAAEKELQSAKNMQTYYSAQADKANSELAQAHAVLDGVEGAPPRKYEVDGYTQERNVVTRLAGAFLAIAKSGGVK